MQNYGLSSVPSPGAEALMLSVGAQRGHLVAIAVDDPRHRPTGQADGEVSLYSHHGQRVHLKADGSIHMSAAAGQQASLQADGSIVLSSSKDAPALGIVTGECICAFTGAPHVMSSTNVKASL